MMSPPIFTEPEAPSQRSAADSGPPDGGADRVARLEEEVAELRETIARFADLMIGEVKDLRQHRAEVLPPAAVGELPAAGDAADSAGGRRPWLLTEFLHDVGTTFRMYFDPRYRVRRATQLMVPLLIAMFVLNGLFFNQVFAIAIVSPVLEKIGDIILAVVLYKVISRELQRYRQVIAQLMAWQDYRVRSAAVISAEPAMTPLETE